MSIIKFISLGHVFATLDFHLMPQGLVLSPCSPSFQFLEVINFGLFFILLKLLIKYTFLIKPLSFKKENYSVFVGLYCSLIIKYFSFSNHYT